jgi:hypothetical protein
MLRDTYRGVVNDEVQDRRDWSRLRGSNCAECASTAATSETGPQCAGLNRRLNPRHPRKIGKALQTGTYG